MKLTVVGCTGSMSGPASPASCYLVQARGADPATGRVRTWSAALDMGPGAFGALWRHLDPRLLDAVVLSHCHADHIGDIISLHVHRRWFPGGGLAPVLLAGPQGTLERVRQIDGVGPQETYAGEFRPLLLRAGVPFRVGPMTFTPAAARHPVPAFGVRVEGPAQQDPARRVSLVYTGDTDTCPSIDALAEGADLLLAEAGFAETETVRGIHLTGTRAGLLAAQAGAGALVLTHIQPWNDPAVAAKRAAAVFDGPVRLATTDAVYAL